MISLTYLPMFIRILFLGLPGVWKSRHSLIFCWLVVLQSILPGRKTLMGMSLSAPSHVTEWRFRRLLSAGYWSIQILVQFFADQAIAAIPPSENGDLFLIGDSSKKDKRGDKNPAAQKGRQSKDEPYFFGIRFAVLMAAWDVYRIPVAFRIILPKTHPKYKNENALFREMVQSFTPPEWAKLVIVLGDCAYASKENMKMVKDRDKSDSQRRWGFVFGIAKTWKTEDNKKLRDLAFHLPKKYFKKTWIPRLPEERGRKVFWVYGKTLRLRHIGDVTVVLTKTGRNAGPRRTKILVTNLTELTLRQVISIYNRRWSVEILFKELKSGLGLGEHQVTGNEDRIEKSIGISVIAYLFLIRACHDEIKPGKTWSIFQLQNNLRLRIITNQVEHNTERKLKKLQKLL